MEKWDAWGRRDERLSALDCNTELSINAFPDQTCIYVSSYNFDGNSCGPSGLLILCALVSVWTLLESGAKYYTVENLPVQL